MLDFVQLICNYNEKQTDTSISHAKYFQYSSINSAQICAHKVPYYARQI